MLKNRASAERSRKRKQVPLPPESPSPRHPCRSTPGCGGRKSDGRELVLCTLHDAITPAGQDYVEELEMKLSCALSEKDILLSKIHKAMSHAKGMMLSKASTP